MLPEVAESKKSNPSRGAGTLASCFLLLHPPCSSRLLLTSTTLPLMGNNQTNTTKGRGSSSWAPPWSAPQPDSRRSSGRGGGRRNEASERGGGGAVPPTSGDFDMHGGGHVSVANPALERARRAGRGSGTRGGPTGTTEITNPVQHRRQQDPGEDASTGTRSLRAGEHEQIADLGENVAKVRQAS